jgi:prophage antirepressor-like protein
VPTSAGDDFDLVTWLVIKSKEASVTMPDSITHPETRIALFQRKEIRRAIHNNEWWFVITDVIAALTGSVDPQGYLKDMRRRDPELAKGWGQIATPLSIPTVGGPQNLNCANAEGLFRLIQSIPSSKAAISGEML